MTVDLTGIPEDARSRYMLVKASSLNTLPVFVTAAIEAGWICSGSPFFDDRGNTWVQAMVRIVQIPTGEVRLKEPKRK